MRPRRGGSIVAAVTRRAWLEAEPFTLVLSAGFFGFYSHTGLLHALEHAGVRPRRVIGVSAGALAGGLWAAGLPAEALARELLALRRRDFWDPGLPLFGLLRGRKFAAELRRVLAATGRVAIEQCELPFVAIAHDVLSRRTLPIDRGDLADAIRASCTVPLMFRPMLLGGRVVVDGGVSDRIGRVALQPGERVLMHLIPSRRRVGRNRAAEVMPPLDAQVLVTPGVPALGPFALAQAEQAYRVTRRHAQAWLEQHP